MSKIENPYYTTLRNGVRMPSLIQGFSLLNNTDLSYEKFYEVMQNSITFGIRAFDTAHAYGRSEEFTGLALQKILYDGIAKREDLFITTKIDNEQQLGGNINQTVDDALKILHLDYLDCMLLHWPYPNIYIKNWRELESIYKSGKVRSIGIANVKERHLIKLKESGVEIMPHVVQVEHHPFNSNPTLKQYLQVNNIRLQAYSSLCRMLPLVTENPLLQELAKKYSTTISSIILRWDIQQGVAPIFRSFNTRHVKDTLNCYNLDMSIEDIEAINRLNINYKFHPESVNCPGY